MARSFSEPNGVEVDYWEEDFEEESPHEITKTSDLDEGGFIDDPIRLYLSQLPTPMSWEEQHPMLERMCTAQRAWLLEVLQHPFVASKMTNFFEMHLKGEGERCLWDKTIGRAAPKEEKERMLKITRTNVQTVKGLLGRLQHELEWGSRDVAGPTMVRIGELLLECRVSPRIISNFLDELRNTHSETQRIRKNRHDAVKPETKAAHQQKLLDIRATYGPPDVLSGTLKNVDRFQSVVEQVRGVLSETNLKLIPTIVKKYRRRGFVKGYEFLDSSSKCTSEV
ncbi:hypothetical protein A3D88_04700 [Candidatus Peribacteria bacterium RIFCSPHIGHO2_02_FULL_52_16]|nr:MAG: hypothetical protein A2706_03330 [Candidatus Peribacteria bacterium RIFCSPHIGHO2_01_FULL_51_35]OGJ60901.1 MAG: hypothetical protein A3D88_04700 [Candidatus Peribacteria bacterium RIFCSPHIGHO2_02_FULL_52_16]